MTNEAFLPLDPMPSQYGFGTNGMSSINPTSRLDQNGSLFGMERNGVRPESQSCAALVIRKLPLNTTTDGLKSMLLFAKNFTGVEFSNSSYITDPGYKTAIARFNTLMAAQEARDMLHDKPNASGEANMIVEVVTTSPGGTTMPRRNTLDHRDSSSVATNGQLPRQASKFGPTFQALGRISPPRAGFMPGEMSLAEASGVSSSAYANNPSASSSMYGGLTSSSASGYPSMNTVTSNYQNIFNPQSPLGGMPPLERQRVSGKSVIGEDGVDDETGKLLQDPVGFAMQNLAESNMAGGNMGMSRRSTMANLPNFQGLSLNGSGPGHGNMNGVSSPRPLQPLQSPTNYGPSKHLGPAGSYQYNAQFSRQNYPPVNPADQNPPCNTLYVGNLPVDTSEDELKAMFCKQKGYKRLCFRTKANGPMCFVEFEDISYATKALTELYGHMLHNSVKGGIRLSFSKNPLGVRTTLNNPIGINSPMSPQSPMSLNGHNAMQSFSTASGPPPGLTPPGLPHNGSSSLHHSGPLSPLTTNGFHGGPLSPPLGNGVSGMRSPTMMSGGNPWNIPNGRMEYGFVTDRS